jgi:hypothetical protein
MAEYLNILGKLMKQVQVQENTINNKRSGNCRHGQYFYGIFIIFGLNPVEKVRVGGGGALIHQWKGMGMNE